MKIPIFLVSVLLIICVESVTVKEIQKKIQGRLKELYDSQQANNTEGLADVYTKQALFLPRAHEKVIGNKNIAAYIIDLHKDGVVRITIKSKEVLPYGKSCSKTKRFYVAEWGKYKFFGVNDKPIQKGEYMCIWRVYPDGNVRIHWNLYNREVKY